MAQIVTERLLLRPSRAEDLPAFVAYRSDPEVARYQSWDAMFSMADAERFLASQRGVELGTPGEWLQLAAVDRRSKMLCGDCAVRVLTAQPATAEVGVTFAPAHQGWRPKQLAACSTRIRASSRSSATARAQRSPRARRHVQGPAARLDPEAVAARVDERAHVGRSGSSCLAKNTDADVRISFARRSS